MNIKKKAHQNKQFQHEMKAAKRTEEFFFFFSFFPASPFFPCQNGSVDYGLIYTLILIIIYKHIYDELQGMNASICEDSTFCTSRLIGNKLKWNLCSFHSSQGALALYRLGIDES